MCIGRHACVVVECRTWESNPSTLSIASWRCSTLPSTLSGRGAGRGEAWLTHPLRLARPTPPVVKLQGWWWLRWASPASSTLEVERFQDCVRHPHRQIHHSLWAESSTEGRVGWWVVVVWCRMIVSHAPAPLRRYFGLGGSLTWPTPSTSKMKPSSASWTFPTWAATIEAGRLLLGGPPPVSALHEARVLVSCRD